MVVEGSRAGIRSRSGVGRAVPSRAVVACAGNAQPGGSPLQVKQDTPPTHDTCCSTQAERPATGRAQ